MAKKPQFLFNVCLPLQILPYVNGTLYSLLTNPKIAATARTLHFSEKLKLAIAATANDPEIESGYDEEARQQISFVLQQYEESSSSSSSENSSIASTTMSSLSDDGYEEDEESNDEDVDIEDEVDLYDPVVASESELSGKEENE